MKKIVLLVIFCCFILSGYAAHEQDNGNVIETEQSGLQKYLHDYYDLRQTGTVIHHVEVPVVVVKVNSLRRTGHLLCLLRETVAKQEYKILSFIIADIVGTSSTQRYEKGYFIFDLCKILI